MSVSPSRRRLLQAALLVPLVPACTAKRSGNAAPTDPDVAIRAAAIARERALIDRYRAAAASSSPAVASKTIGLADEHEQHLAALRAPSPPPSSSPPVPAAVPTLAELAAAEHTAAGAHAAAALQASRPLAAVLASLAASEASHAVVLS